MRFSKLFGKTLRQAPAEAESISHQLLLRTGMIAQEAAGIYSYLPLGWRVLRKIEQIIREEMDKAGGQELLLPVLQPFEFWQQSGRNVAFGESLFTMTDRRKRILALGPTHEEVVADLVSRYVQSYRDLPLLLYQIQTKLRDEPRPRGGLLRVREFIMKDLYSLDADESGLDESYRLVSQAYRNVYARMDLPTLMIEADSGAIGGKESHEFMVLSETGEDEIIHCAACGYAANAEKAEFNKAVESDAGAAPSPGSGAGNPRELPSMEEIATPEARTIVQVADLVDVPTTETLKSVFYVAGGEFLIVVIRGDLDINETKLTNALKCSDLRLATEDEVSKSGLFAGFASPVGLKGVRVVADDSVKSRAHFITGANKSGYHLRNINYPRDFQADVVADVALARTGHRCPRCRSELSSVRGIEVGHVFKLGTFISERFGASFLDRDGGSRPVIMGSYGIGLGRLLAAVVEQSHDDKGIIWPQSIAPYQVCLCSLHADRAEISAAAEQIYEDLQQSGLEVLFDDRIDSPGVKFNDADLLGIPLRLTLSPRTLESRSVEAKRRTEKESRLLPFEDLTRQVTSLLAETRESQP